VADLEHTVNEFLSTAYNETCAPHLKLSLKWVMSMTPSKQLLPLWRSSLQHPHSF
jgi:hypothetical protein